MTGGLSGIRVRGEYLCSVRGELERVLEGYQGMGGCLGVECKALKCKVAAIVRCRCLGFRAIYSSCG